ncbi:hypothetical protein BDY17DRAFT_300986 [Neohortaea acidophila]|uniref:Zn(2)-C6 fungal-type domain-containing protein n=1 Tax=Neohortaea acidophila TaxID=245834 RepID=A0A6A6PNQ8_9PEZI|nr:uncharacterized protein BDY17DRAFT_300986 [Neohortaea acidophila]KAF2481264.1 hypothetical protein BDY17DRAFT_300986 [Neohortaea acidophila]
MRPQIACSNCRYRKKKCNRAYPSCSYCLRTHSRCTYVSGKHRVSPIPPVEIETPQSHSVDGDLGISPWSDALFLDAALFRARGHSTPDARLVPDARLRQELELDTSHEQYFARYLEIFQSWISIIPPQEISTTLSAPPATLDGENLLLLACIRLHAAPLLDRDPRTKLYVAIKSSLASAEVHGALSVQLLQTQVLVLLYEFGHGIYPGAYLTLGRCVDYLAALGIDEDAPDARQGSTWIETELHRRLWWAVFIMERHVARPAWPSCNIVLIQAQMHRHCRPWPPSIPLRTSAHKTLAI